MTLDEFSEALDRYGADLQHWPERQRTAARALLAGDASAVARLAEAAKLDALLSAAAAPVPVDAALLGAIAARTGARRNELVVRPTRRLLAAASAAMIVLFVLGFGLGSVLGPGGGDDATALLLFDGPDDLGELL
ncbi:MAG: hypothetical protein ABI399_08370 [Bauldia sp.]